MYNLLLVEDSEDDVLLFQIALRRYPEIKLVGRASDGGEAMEYLGGKGAYADRDKHPFPDVVVTDLKMPQVNGFELLEWMKGMDRRPKVAVFTTSALDQDRERALELGADLFQSKTCEAGTFERFAHWVSRLCEVGKVEGEACRVAC